ncbi:cation:proton antiporter [Verrucomicrobiaceae bacterium R5-34]|nr:cation:proton antiporter [Verrucomicrobiaceae bacterium R5-34]
MASEHAFEEAFLYLSATIVAVLIGKRLGIGAVLGYLTVGALVGPWGIGLIGREGEQIAHFAEFGVVVMLFLIGLELRPAMLWKMRHQLIGLGSLQVTISAAAITGLAIWFGLTWQVSLAVGLTLALSSTAIVLQTLTEKKLLRTVAGQNSFAVLLFQDIAVIPMIALIPLLGVGMTTELEGAEASDWMAHLPLYARALMTFAAIGLVIVVGQLGMRHVFRAISRTHQREAFTGVALLLVIAVALLMTKVGLSPALGAFVAGVVLATSEYRHELESDLEPFKGILLGLFFLGVGAGIDFGYIGDHWLLVVSCAVGLILVKGLILFLFSMVKDHRTDTSLLFAASLAAGGEFAFVLIELSSDVGIFGTELSRSLTAIVALSMATTPLLILAAQRRMIRRSIQHGELRAEDVEDEGSPVIICGFGRFGHAVGRLLRSRGHDCTVLDHDPDQVDLLRQMGIPIFYGDASRPEMLGIAGAAHAKVLVIALKDVSATLKIIETARRNFPHLRIYVRAWSRVEAYDLINAGVEQIYRETLDSSIRLGGDVLLELGESEGSAERATQLYRERDEETVREMAKHRHDKKRMISAALEAHRSLREIMRKDREESEEVGERSE